MHFQVEAVSITQIWGLLKCFDEPDLEETLTFHLQPPFKHMECPILHRLFRDNLLAGATAQWRKSYKEYDDMAEVVFKSSKAPPNPDDNNRSITKDSMETEILGGYPMAL
jgi:hypothetical protein